MMMMIIMMINLPHNFHLEAFIALQYVMYRVTKKFSKMTRYGIPVFQLSLLKEGPSSSLIFVRLPHFEVICDVLNLESVC